jgi:hypothetical protein
MTMSDRTMGHLASVDEAIAKAKGILARYGYPDDLRTVMVAGFISQMIEHHGAMLLLCKNGAFGSAFALGRSIVESMYRGMWINFCATDAQLTEFNRDDRFPVKMPQMAREIDAGYRADGFFEDLLNRSWAALCSYTHTGLLQLGRRFTQNKVEPAYTDEEVVEITTTATTCILLLTGKFMAVQGHADDCREAEAIIGTYGPVREKSST